MLCRSCNNITHTLATMSSFGHEEGILKNPTFGHDFLEDPAHIAAGKVLEQNRIKARENLMQFFSDESGKQASRLSWIAKFVLVLVLVVSLTAIVLCLLLVTGIINISNGSSNQQEGR